MHIERIAVQSVGPFAGPITIDGLSPRLNVLASPNETGKSTLLKALNALFFETYRTTKQSIEALRPYTGGAPFIGATFEVGGHRWQLEKQFLSARRAFLGRLDQSERHEGADAENRLNQLIALPATGERNGSDGATLPLEDALRLLWVAQGDGFKLPELSDTTRSGFAQILSTEAEMSAGLGRAQVILEDVQRELDTLLTRTGRPKKGGALDELTTARAETIERLEGARRRAHAAAARHDELLVLQREALELADSETRARLERQLATRRQRFEDAKNARRHLRELHQTVSFLEEQLRSRRAALAEHEAAVAEHARLTKSVADADDALHEIAKQSIELDQKLADAEIALETAQSAERAARAAAAATHHLEERRNRAQRLVSIGAQAERVTAIEDQISACEKRLSHLDWPPDTIAVLRRDWQIRERIAATERAGAARIRLHYVPGRQTGFRSAGRELADGDEITITSPLVIEIEGIGRIEIQPGRQKGDTDTADERHEAETRIEAALARMSASDLDEAEAQDAERARLINARDLLRSEFDTLAPEGSEALRRELTELRRVHASEADDELADDLSADAPVPPPVDLAALEGAQRTAQATASTLRQQKSRLDARRSEIATELRIARTQREELGSRIASDGETGAPRDRLAADVAAGESELSKAVRKQSAWSETAMDDKAMALLEDDITERARELEGRTARLYAVRETISRLEGTLARDNEEGAGVQVAELDAERTYLETRLNEVEARVDALRLLRDELDQAITRRRNEIAGPLAQRLSGFACRVWPAAELSLSANLCVDRLIRADTPETPGQVSDGTREQMALLSRLAYADLIAESGEAAPLILDDPLVFSDDERLKRVFEVMADAAVKYQIIVLTCHAEAFEPLIAQHGAKRLMLERNQDRAIAASA